MKTNKTDSLKAQPSHCLMKDYEARAHTARSQLFHRYLKKLNGFYHHLKHK